MDIFGANLPLTFRHLPRLTRVNTIRSAPEQVPFKSYKDLHRFKLIQLTQRVEQEEVMEETLAI